ncbi:hypothetical protein XELAEV_18041613mg [Xenopus laevis]|uniref:Uncharacterized protein n=1 Tax=Xenopus laevis TaxID=8355 RepID=A0A974H587_XENLA|nr:hypothetical protein XELAEV_18041613mg [Xenopus laevis]
MLSMPSFCGMDLYRLCMSILLRYTSHCGSAVSCSLLSRYWSTNLERHSSFEPMPDTIWRPDGLKSDLCTFGSKYSTWVRGCSVHKYTFSCLVITPLSIASCVNKYISLLISNTG